MKPKAETLRAKDLHILRRGTRLSTGLAEGWGAGPEAGGPPLAPAWVKNTQMCEGLIEGGRLERVGCSVLSLCMSGECVPPMVQVRGSVNPGKPWGCGVLEQVPRGARLGTGAGKALACGRGRREGSGGLRREHAGLLPAG